MNITEALDQIETILTAAKAGDINVEEGNYWYIPDTRERFFISAGGGFITYLEITEDENPTVTRFESFTTHDPDTGEENRVGDQWNDLIELNEEDQNRFLSLLAAYRLE